MPDQTMTNYEVLNLLIGLLAAVGTIGATAVALFQPRFQKSQEKRDLRGKILLGLSKEIYWNYRSIYDGGMMEIIIAQGQYNEFKNNLHLFSRVLVETYGDDMTQIYNLFRLYEHEWQKQHPIYTYYMYELKFRIKMEVLCFTGIIDRMTARRLTSLLSQILLGISKKDVAKMLVLTTLILKDEEVFEWIKQHKGSDYLEIKVDTHGGKATRADREVIIKLFETYVDTTYPCLRETIDKKIIAKLTQVN